MKSSTFVWIVQLDMEQVLTFLRAANGYNIFTMLLWALWLLWGCPILWLWGYICPSLWYLGDYTQLTARRLSLS